MADSSDTSGTARFDAFISYSRRDVKFARWLERALERYRPPRAFASKRLDVFRDVQDLVGNELSDAIATALRRSAALLVICSPSSRESHWVGREIDAFVEQNGPSRILPVLFCGRPNHEVTAESGGQDAAFHEALYRHLQEPLAADFRRFPGERWIGGRDRQREAKYQVLAFLLNATKEALLRRQRQRTRWLVSLALAAMLIVTVAFGWIAWVANENKKEAQHQQAVAEERLATAQSREFAANAMSMLDDDPELATLLALHASDISRTSEADDALRQALGSNRLIKHYPGTGYAISLDGNTVAIEGTGDQYGVFAIMTGETILDARMADVMALSPTGRYLAVAGTASAPGTLWDVAASAQLGSLSYGSTDLIFSPNGERLLSISNAPVDEAAAHRLVALEVSTGRVLVDTPIPEYVDALAWNADGRYILLADGASFNNATYSYQLSGSQTRLFDVDAARQRVVNLGQDAVTAVQTHPDANSFAFATRDGRVCRYFIDSGKVGFCQSGIDSWVTDIDVSVDGSLIAASSVSGWVYILEPEINNLRRSNRRHERQAMAVALSPDGKHILSGGAEGTALLFDTESGGFVLSLGPNKDFVDHVAFSEDGRHWITGNMSGDLKVWEARLWNEKLDLSAHRMSVHNAAFSHNSELLVTYGQDITVKVWDTASGKLVANRQLGAHGGSPVFGNDQNTIYIDTSIGLEVWNWTQEEIVKELGTGTSFAVNANPPRLAVSGIGVMEFYDSENWALLAPLNSAEFARNALPLFSADGGYLLLRTEPRAVGIFRTDDGKRLWSIREDQEIVSMVFFAAPDQVATVVGNQASLWQLEPIKRLATIDSSLQLSNVAVSPLDGTFMLRAVTRESSVDRQCRHLIYSDWGDMVPRELDSTSCLVEYSPRGRFIFSWEGAVWDAETLELLPTAWGDDVYHMVFSNDERYVATAGGPVAHVYRSEAFLPIEDLQDIARARLTRSWSQGELEKYFGRPLPNH